MKDFEGNLKSPRAKIAALGKKKRQEPSLELLVSKKGTPPANMNPLTDDDWWDICRDETAAGIEHEGIYPGCYECYAMCSSHPAVTEPTDLLECVNKALVNCVAPEVGDSLQMLVDYINPPDTCEPWEQFDKNTFESDSCRDPIACSNECQRLCPEEGFTSGQCQTAGDMYYCNCS